MTIDATASRRASGLQDRRFYTVMAVAAAAVVFVGFAPTYFLRGAYRSDPLPTYLQVHGFLFATWIVVFVAQTTLVALGRRDVHRRVGWAAAVLAALMIVAGITAGILSMRAAVEAGSRDEALAFLTTPLFSMAAFAGFVAAAIARRRDAAAHKRLMLLATISILDAAVARLPLDVLRSSTWAYLPATDLFLVAAIAYDLASRRSVHPALAWGSALLVVEQLLRIPVGGTDAWQRFAMLILGVES